MPANRPARSVRKMYSRRYGNNKCQQLPAGKRLRIELREPALVHWSADGWQTTRDATTRDTGLGIHVVDLPSAQLDAGAELVFTFHWTGSDRWEAENFRVTVYQPSQENRV